MKAMLHAFTGDYMSLQLGNFLELAAFPHRRASVGVVCHPLDPDEPRLIDEPRLTAVSLLQRSGMHMGMSRVSPLWTQLKRIPGLGGWGPSDPAFGLAKPKSLSSNRLFLGIMSSPRPIHLITSRSKMEGELENNFQGVEARLFDIYDMRPNVHFLEGRVVAIATHHGLPRPKGRNRDAYLLWLKENWTIARRELCGMINRSPDRVPSEDTPPGHTLPEESRPEDN